MVTKVPSPSAFTTTQITQYLQYLRLPPTLCPESIPLPANKLTIELLYALHTAHLVRIPYENLSLHYRTNNDTRELFGDVNIDPSCLFEKIITNARNRGGYCMENGIAFLNLLKGIGFDVYAVGGRVRPRKDGRPFGNYYGWVHIMSIVTLPSGDRYMCDVAFGGDVKGSVQPLPMKHGHVSRNIGNQHLRLIYDNVPGQSNLRSKFWIYQYRNEGPPETSPDAVKTDIHISHQDGMIGSVKSQENDETVTQYDSTNGWYSFYHVSDATEFLHQDFEVMNFFTSKGLNIQTLSMLVIRFIMRCELNFYRAGATIARPVMENDDDEARAIVGKVMLVNEVVKLNLGGKTEVVQVLKTETERIEALKKWFDIELTRAERAGIGGSKLELPQV